MIQETRSRVLSSILNSDIKDAEKPIFEALLPPPREHLGALEKDVIHNLSSTSERRHREEPRQADLLNAQPMLTVCSERGYGGG
jgi:hypothetical protein